MEEFKEKCREYTRQLAALGYNGRKMCAGETCLARCSIMLRMALLMIETGKTLDKWKLQEDEANEIIKDQEKLDNLGW